MIQEKLWTKDFIVLSIINFITFLVFLSLLVSIAPYAMDKFHTSPGIAGLVSGIFIIGVLAGRLGTGLIIDSLGSKNILITGGFLFIMTSLLYFAAANLPLLILFRFLHGLSFGILSTASGTIIAQIIPLSRRGEGIGFYSMGAILGLALGPFVGIFITQYVEFKAIFIFTTLLSAFSFVISFIIGDRVLPSAYIDKRKIFPGFRISNFLEQKALPISIISFVVCFSYSVIVPFISLYARELHLEKAASFYFLVYCGAILLSRPFSGRLLDFKGGNFVIYPCLVIFACGMILLSQAASGIALLSAGVLIGLGFGNFISCAQTLSIKMIPPHRLGLATSTFFIFTDLGLGLGPFVLGLLIPFVGFRGLYLAMSGVILISIVLYYFIHSKRALPVI